MHYFVLNINHLHNYCYNQNQAYSEYKHLLTFRIRRYVVIATKPVHQLQICPTMQNYRAHLLFP